MADQTFTGEVIEFDAIVTEMAADAGAIVQLDPTRVQALIAATQDEKPEFPIVRVESGVSRNGNNWTPEVLRDIAEQFNKNEPVGYLGHIKPEDDGYAFPDPQTIWLKAITREEGDKTVLYVKGYNFPNAKIREYLRAGVTKATSWRGKASGKVVSGVRHIERFLMESNDWSRKGKQGMAAEVVAIASEMEGRSENDVDWAKVTLKDIEENNPALFTLMKQKVEADNAATVSEMKKKVEDGEEAQSVVDKLYAALGIKAEDNIDPIEKVTELVSKIEKIGTEEIRKRVKAILAKKFKDNDRVVTVLDRVMPVTEMEKVVTDAGDDEEKLVKGVDEWLSTDESAKAIVTEMAQAPAPLTRRKVELGDGDGVGKSGMVKTTSRKL